MHIYNKTQTLSVAKHLPFSSIKTTRGKREKSIVLSKHKERAPCNLVTSERRSRIAVSDHVRERHGGKTKVTRVRCPSDTLHDALKDVIRMLSAMTVREVHARQRFPGTLFHELRHAARPQFEMFDCDRSCFPA